MRENIANRVAGKRSKVSLDLQGAAGSCSSPSPVCHLIWTLTFNCPVFILCLFNSWKIFHCDFLCPLLRSLPYIYLFIFSVAPFAVLKLHPPLPQGTGHARSTSAHWCSHSLHTVGPQMSVNDWGSLPPIASGTQPVTPSAGLRIRLPVWFMKLIIPSGIDIDSKGFK